MPFFSVVRRFLIAAPALCIVLSCHQAGNSDSLKGDTLLNDTPVYNSTEAAKNQNAAKFYNDSLRKDAAIMVEAYERGLYTMHAGLQAETTAVSDNVKTYARALALTHDTLNHQLVKLASISGISLPDSLTAAQQERLDNEHMRQGLAFDKAYIGNMIEAQQEAIALYKKGARECSDKDTRSWFASVLPKIRRQLQKAQQIEGKIQGEANMPAQ